MAEGSHASMQPVSGAGDLASQDMAVLTAILNRRQHMKDRFSHLAAQWRQERNPYSSDPTSPASSPAYLKIIAMGAEAIPLVLEEMQQRPDHWFIALESLTDENPIAIEHEGNFSQMVEDWLAWGRKNGFLSN